MSACHHSQIHIRDIEAHSLDIDAGQISLANILNRLSECR